MSAGVPVADPVRLPNSAASGMTRAMPISPAPARKTHVRLIREVVAGDEEGRGEVALAGADREHLSRVTAGTTKEVAGADRDRDQDQSREQGAGSEQADDVLDVQSEH